MSIDMVESKPKLVKGMTKKEYHRAYMREWSRRTKDLHMQPAATSKFKAYYSEYKMIKQQEGEPIVNFPQFFQQFCELGYLSWRAKVKGK